MSIPKIVCKDNRSLKYERRMHSSRMRTARSSSRHKGGLHTTPSPWPDLPQLPPWVWAWTRSLSTSPLGVGLDQIPLNFPLRWGSGPDPPQLPLGCGPGGPPPVPDPPRTRHPPCGQTHTCKNITFANFVCGR